MKAYGLLGRHLSHSYSPAIHGLLGDYPYRLFEVEPGGLEAFLKSGDFAGLNVTIPYKRGVMPYCAALSPEAEAIGSVNTLLRQPDGSLVGHNTDGAGFRAMVKESGIEVKGAKALVLGSGGASHTVCHVLRELEAAQVVVISRHGEDNYENLSRHRDAALIVNTTPVGMYPQTEEAPLSLAGFPQCRGVLDLIYNPARTRLLQEAAQRGIPHLGGLTMLVSQAAAAAGLFTGEPIDPALAREAVKTLRARMENLVLIGMPGCGKTTVGRALAKLLDRPFVDADEELVNIAGTSIPDIFQAEGEAGFRRRESALLGELGKGSGLVIATGGGCVTREENYQSLHQNGVVVFLKRPLEDLDREGRPLSQGADLEAMYRRRLPLYEAFADVTIENKAPAEETAGAIWEAVYEIFGAERP